MVGDHDGFSVLARGGHGQRGPVGNGPDPLRRDHAGCPPLAPLDAIAGRASDRLRGGASRRPDDRDDDRPGDGRINKPAEDSPAEPLGWGGQQERFQQVGLAQDLGEALVHDGHHSERADHDIGRLQVPVDHALGVGIGDGIAEFFKDKQ